MKKGKATKWKRYRSGQWFIPFLIGVKTLLRWWACCPEPAEHQHEDHQLVCFQRFCEPVFKYYIKNKTQSLSIVYYLCLWVIRKDAT